MAKKKAAAVAETPALPTDVPAPAERAAEYTVLARRYRPQQFADLIGQEPVAQSLMNAIKSNRVAHAYLFTGARGVGKTSSARILAKALNCEKGPTTTPCDQCENCKAIMSGDDTDVLEIDGASNRGIDEIRDLRANVQYRPTRTRYKVYIIDEVHMLTKEAFNALLKTLEEPPPHVKFIFATTEAHKIPVTILSRCQRFDFSGIGMTQIVARLREIVASEKMEADDEALELVARRAGGSMRDAQSLLDQLLAFGSDRLTVERVHQLLGTAHEERVVALAAAIGQRDARQALAQLGQIVDQGQQLGELLDQLIEYWRDLMVVQAAGVEGQTLSVTSKHRDALATQAKALSPDSVLAGLDVLVNAKNRLRNTSHGRVVLEIALVRLCQLEQLVSLSQLAQWLSKDAPPPPRTQAAAPFQIAPAAATVSAVAASPVPASSSTPTREEEKKKPSDPGPPVVNHLALETENLEAIRQQLLLQSGLMVSNELRRLTSLAISAPNALVFRFPARYNLDGDKILEGERRAEVTELLAKIVGKPCQVRIETVADEMAPPVNGHAAPLIESPAQKARKQRADLMELPLVSRAVEILGAQIVGVDEEFGKSPVA